MGKLKNIGRLIVNIGKVKSSSSNRSFQDEQQAFKNRDDIMEQVSTLHTIKFLFIIFRLLVRS